MVVSEKAIQASWNLHPVSCGEMFPIIMDIREKGKGFYYQLYNSWGNLSSAKSRNSRLGMSINVARDGRNYRYTHQRRLVVSRYLNVPIRQVLRPDFDHAFLASQLRKTSVATPIAFNSHILTFWPPKFTTSHSTISLSRWLAEQMVSTPEARNRIGMTWSNPISHRL